MDRIIIATFLILFFGCYSDKTNDVRRLTLELDSIRTVDQIYRAEARSVFVLTARTSPGF